MAALPCNLNYSRNFPLLPKPYSTLKQRHLPKTRNRRTKHVNENNNDQTCIDDLNDTLLELIFISLQWRQLVTSKCVSARWNSIISNPDFLRHLPLEHSSPFTLYIRGKKPIPYSFNRWSTIACVVTEHPYFHKHKLRLNFLPSDDEYINIVANYKDLLITYRTLRSSLLSAYYVSNPLTKQFIVVPLPSCWVSCSAVGFAGVVQGVSTPGITHSNDYNNDGFRIVQIEENYNVKIMEIYSSKRGGWTSYPLNNTGFNFKSLNKKTVTLNNNVCFEGASQILVVDPFDDDIIVTPRVFNFPDEINPEQRVLGVSQNRLHIAQFEANPNVSNDYPRIKVWEFEDLTNDYSIAKTAELRLVIDFPLKPDLFERIMPPIFKIFPTKDSWKWSHRVICCHPYDPKIVYFIYRDTFYRCDVVKQKLKAVTYRVDDWTETYVFLHPSMITPN